MSASPALWYKFIWLTAVWVVRPEGHDHGLRHLPAAAPQADDLPQASGRHVQCGNSGVAGLDGAAVGSHPDHQHEAAVHSTLVHWWDWLCRPSKLLLMHRLVLY